MIKTNALEIAASALEVKSSEEILVDCSRLFECPLAVLLLVNQESLVMQAAYGTTVPTAEGGIIPFGEGISGKAIQTKQLCRIIDTETVPPEDRAREPYYSGSLASVCLVYNNTVIGMLNLCRPRPLPGFVPGELQYLVSFASQISFSLVSQYLIGKKTEELARTQTSLVYANQQLREDISRREQAEAELRRTQIQERALLDNIPDLTWLKDREGRYVATNEAYGKACGLRPQAMAGKTDLDIWPKEMAEAYMRDDREVILTGKRKQIEEPVVDIEKGIHYVETIKTPVFNEAGEIIGTTGIARDVTERRRYEEALKTTNADLARKEQALQAMLSTLQQAQEEIRKAQRQLLQSEKLASIGQLAAGIAHEINNPLSFINSNLQTLAKYTDSFGEIAARYEQLLRAADTDKNALLDSFRAAAGQDGLTQDAAFVVQDGKDLINESLDGIERIKRIVLDLKTFARQDDGARVVADMNSVLDGVLTIVWSEIKYKAELIKEYGSSRPVRCNQQQIGQVFINILVNAVQAMKEKGTITIRTFDTTAGICVEVRDTGSGIPQDIIDRIFDPFFTTKEVGKGTGLGLSISYDIIKKHHGDIEVESEVGKGTLFRISLPAHDGDAKESV